MNCLKNLFLFTMLFISVIACSDDSNESKLALSVDSKAGNEVRFDARGGKSVFTVQADGDWNIETDGQTWYSVTPLSGSGTAEVTVTTDAFEAEAGRSALLTVRCGGSSVFLAITQTYLVSPDDPASQNIAIRAKGGDKEILLPENDGYEVRVPSGINWISVKERKDDSVILTFETNNGTEYRDAEILVYDPDGERLATLNITQSWRNIEPGELLIEEIFCTGNLIASTGSPDKAHGDQYFRLTNNTDETLYIDGTIIAESYITTSGSMYNYDPDIRPEAAPVQAIYVIPGDGSRYPLKAHQSVIIANNAQNHKAANPDSFDLSNADFEWYNESTVTSMLDTDNPDVPNLDIWIANTLSVWVLHDRGYKGYVIAQLPPAVSKDDYLSDEAYLWEAEESWSSGENDFSFPIKEKIIPNDWILDGVALGTKEGYKISPFDSSIDAGFTYCSLNSDDKDRYGKGVRRKSADGRLVDTNNSTNDFEAYTTELSMAR